MPDAEASSSFSNIYRTSLALRYFVVRIVAVPVPFLKSSIPVIGGRTFIELLVIVGFAAFGLGTAGGGGTTNILCAIMVVLGMRNNALHWLVGVSFERAIFWHKCMAVLSLSAMTIHALSKGNNGTGLVLAGLMGATSVIYLIKHLHFEIFYNLHIVLFLGIIVVAALHGASIFAFMSVIWAVDIVLRYIITSRRVKADVVELPGDVVKISFPNAFHYEPGQYVFVMIKKLDYFEFHPFSLSSSPNEDITSIHVRAVGDWSNRLLDMAQKNGPAATAVVAASKEAAILKEGGDGTGGGRGTQQIQGGSMMMDVFIEGPFGAPSIDIFNPKTYSVVLLISGGIGITPLQSVYTHLIHQEQSKQRDLRKVVFVWSVKDRALVDTMLSDGKKSAPFLPTSFQPTMPQTPRKVITRRTVNISAAAPTADLEAPAGAGSTSGGSDVATEGAGKCDEFFNLETNEVFHAEHYLTSVRSEAEFAAAGIDPIHQKHLHFGRPDLAGVFSRTAELCRKEGIEKVGVMVCGPIVMVNDVNDLCRSSRLVGCGRGDGKDALRGVRFDYHAEVFNF